MPQTISAHAAAKRINREHTPDHQRESDADGERNAHSRGVDADWMKKASAQCFAKEFKDITAIRDESDENTRVVVEADAHQSASVKRQR